MFLSYSCKRAYLPRTVLSCRIVIERINLDTVFLSFWVLSLFSFKEEYDIKVKKYAAHIRIKRKIYMNILSHSCSLIDLDQKHFSKINAKMYFESENVILERTMCKCHITKSIGQPAFVEHFIPSFYKIYDKKFLFNAFVSF